MTPSAHSDNMEAARHQIHDALLTYCRGIDRLRPELICAAFHPGATLHDYGPTPLRIEQFAESAPASLEAKFVATQHRLSNTAIEFDADATGATVESYVLAFHWEDTSEGARLHTFNGRYIDRFAQRDGHWKIAQRHLRVDGTSVERIYATMGERWVRSGRGSSADPLWA
ncbi:nuclear transport factor 2 family protein [Candidatus Poriferisodalis sp.]|uniref:nuclear transport factor 2 family protein n=1 Tax=Candidatus Poriferisodalis sp. TaxID=3101277 RepID=UPI003B02C4F8